MSIHFNERQCSLQQQKSEASLDETAHTALHLLVCWTVAVDNKQVTTLATRGARGYSWLGEASVMLLLPYISKIIRSSQIFF